MYVLTSVMYSASVDSSESAFLGASFSKFKLVELTWVCMGIAPLQTSSFIG